MRDVAEAAVNSPPSGPPDHSVIEVDDLVVRYGAATALQGVSLSVGAGEMVALVGPNGAGKSTLVDTLSGVVRPASGTARVNGRLAHVPEGRQLFGELSVEDNLLIGAWGQRDRDPGPVYEVLPDLRGFAGRKAAALSGGQQQMVAIGRALMARPDVIAVDELSLGLAPKVVSDLAAHLHTLNSERGMAVLLIEQNARLAFEMCSRAYVLEAGRMVVTGSCAELARSNEVARAYLGGGTGDEL
ncbi:branched-chain amino acid transport system ATP-binding protein [Lipingzhangella halophila]|uniref:Branched-chain amino acid transport system ATP-binding protein n=1 Tax=Lipingzhangella halophila TaxID=1783352 RepID=A0A7W7RGL8_9ACTN|nr:ABC transporter ATP-binding protein [Lipingzhangella halophila]MBB4931614.1 branched-chain amino acid transport system ATP-binding protein [Lipingzhangella halophila]